MKAFGVLLIVLAFISGMAGDGNVVTLCVGVAGFVILILNNK